MVQVVGPLPSRWETWMEFLVPGQALAMAALPGANLISGQGASLFLAHSAFQITLKKATGFNTYKP